MVKITDVAKEAKVSVATVSRVLNNSENVKTSTKKRVTEAVKKLNYTPNVLGRNLRKTSSRLILVILPEISNPFYSDIVKGIEKHANMKNFNILLCDTENDIKREMVYIDLLKNRLADGAIFLASKQSKDNLEKLALKYPIVQCCEYNKGSKILHVSIDNYKATKEAIQYLVKIKRENILMLSSKNDYLSTKQREKAYIETIKKETYKQAKGYIVKGEYSYLSGYRCIKKFLLQKRKIDAVFCISDLMAIGAMKALKEDGLVVPKDVSVVGFDNLKISSMYSPELTTIAQPRYMIGKKAADILLEMIQGDERNKIESVFLKHQLVIRKSS